MNILMVTNTYRPKIGGVSSSIIQSEKYLRKKEHRVFIVAPIYDDYDKGEKDEDYIIRVPAIKNFNNSGFSLPINIIGLIENKLKGFIPDIIHSHHPFLLGNYAICLSKEFNCPLIFTHHTMYEYYLHYLSQNSDLVKKFIPKLTKNYANLTDRVIAPSLSVKSILEKRGVTTPISVLSSGIDYKKFSTGNGSILRKENNIPSDSFLLGHVGRLSEEKNLLFLTSVLKDFLKTYKNDHTLIIGEGDMKKNMEESFRQDNLLSRVHFIGYLQGKELADAYHAMDLFLFTSKSETQGLVLLEAMSAGVPIIALKATGVEDFIIDNKNGFLVNFEEKELFIKKIKEYRKSSKQFKIKLKESTKNFPKNFTNHKIGNKLLNIYKDILNSKTKQKIPDNWHKIINVAKSEWEILKIYFNSLIE